MAFVAVIIISDIENMKGLFWALLYLFFKFCLGGELQFIKHPRNVTEKLLETGKLSDIRRFYRAQGTFVQNLNT